MNFQEFKKQVDELKKINPEHWGNNDRSIGPVALDRYEYFKEAYKIAKNYKPNKVLEAGSMGITVLKGCDTVDLDLPENNWRLTYQPTYIRDLSKKPYDLPYYDLFIALRVYHHIDEIMLDEMQKIAKDIILALPPKKANEYMAYKMQTKSIYCEKTHTIVQFYKGQK